mgnify:CR=1 FL=1
MTDTVCRDCGRTVDLRHIPATCMPSPDRIQCSRCWVRWLKEHGIWSPLPSDFVDIYRAKRKAAREAQG